MKQMWITCKWHVEEESSQGQEYKNIFGSKKDEEIRLFKILHINELCMLSENQVLLV
jgi:hypothetical protein